MDIKPYGKHSDVVKLLKETGVLKSLPRQILREDLEYDEGIDIIYELKGLTPKKFEQVADMLMLTTVSEANRYKEYKYSFAKLDVKLNRTEKGKAQVAPIRTYIAARHTDPDIMVYGEQALGYSLPEGQKKPFLIDKVKEILGIPDSPSPGIYVTKQSPYKVTRLTICIRAGMRNL